MPWALLAEFDSADALLRAAKALRGDGHAEMEAFTPYPLPELDALLGIPRSPIRWWMLAGAVTGAVAAYGIQWWCTVVDYPLDVGGRPMHSAPAFIPITFELAVLGGALAGIVALLGYTRLPRLYDPMFTVEGFERASLDRYWLAVGRVDPGLVILRDAERLRALGALRVLSPDAEATP